MTSQAQAQLRILAIGAHPDDCDIGAGGVAALYARRGHEVHFVAMTNGDAGHQSMAGAPLARRRQAEAQAAAAVIGIQYLVLDNHDGELEPSLANRRTVIRVIRDIRPDLILTHRLNDYHPDHRYTAQLVQDAAYMVAVPNVVGLSQRLPANPVICYMSDTFLRPYPFTPDVVIAIDDVLDVKMQMLQQHASQFYEWLPFIDGSLAEVPAGEAERLVWLREVWAPRNEAIANRHRTILRAQYGPERAAQIRYAEAFEVSEYGAPLTPEVRQRLWPFLP